MGREDGRHNGREFPRARFFPPPSLSPSPPLLAWAGVGRTSKHVDTRFHGNRSNRLCLNAIPGPPHRSLLFCAINISFFFEPIIKERTDPNLRSRLSTRPTFSTRFSVFSVKSAGKPLTSVSIRLEGEVRAEEPPPFSFRSRNDRLSK